MPSDLNKYIGNVRTFGKFNLDKPTNAPSYMNTRQKRYFDLETSVHNQEMAKYSTDYYLASAQGIYYSDFYAFTDVYIRLADAISASSLTNVVEDFKQILFADSSIDYIGVGAKIETAGNTYLIISPSNTSTVTANALVRRCNTVFHYLDYYGNVISEPMCWSSSKGALATATDNQELMVLMNSYQHSVIQLNVGTQPLIKENARMILGDQAYKMRGVVNFTQEFTEDESSCHIIHFDLEITEPSQYDDMENKVADGLNFSWVINLSGDGSMNVGATQTLTATSLRNGETPDTAVYPVGYTFTTSDENVATVSNSGAVEAIGAGECVITCALAQNPDITAAFPLTVSETAGESYVAWTTAPPASVTQYSDFTATAAYYENGAATSDAVTYSFGGSDPDSYGYETSGNSVAVTCYYPTDEPLTVTASAGGKSVSSTVALLSY